MRPERPCPPAPARSILEVPPSSCAPLSYPLSNYAQSRQHLLYRGQRGVELFGIARANDEIGVRLLVFIEERVAADDRVGMRVSDFAQRAADVTLPRIGAYR